MTRHHVSSPNSYPPHPAVLPHEPHAPPAPHKPHPHPHPTKPSRRKGLNRFIAWEWAIVLSLLSGLTITILVLSNPPDAKHQAAILVEQMQAAAQGRTINAPILGTPPKVQVMPHETVVTMDRVPAKICVLASWELYRLGRITVNGVTPQRVSAARLVELCNDGDSASLIWAVRTTE